MFGQLQTECGYTPAQVREMTLHDVRRLTAHWNRHPPLRALVTAVAGALGVEPSKPAAPAVPYMNADEAAALLAATDGRIPGVGSI